MVTNARFQNLSRFKRVGLIAIAVIVLVPLLFVGVTNLFGGGDGGALSRSSISAAATATAAPRSAAGATAAPTTAAARPAATTAAGSAAALPIPSAAAAATTAPAYAAAPAATTAAGSATSSTSNRGTASDAVGANAPITPSGTDQLIIRTAAITLIVQDVAGTQAQIWGMAEGLGGFVTNSTASGTDDDIRGQITIRVPTVQYVTAMDRLRKFAVKVDSEKSDAQDVSEEYVDISSRRANLELTLQQLQGFLGQAKNVDEALKVQSQLNIVQNDLERIKGRMAYLENRTNFSTITATLLPVVEKKPAPPPPPVPAPSWSFQHSVQEQWHRSLHGLENIADGVIAILVGGWWILLPLVIATVALVRWARQRHPTLQPAPATVPVTPIPPTDAT